jgi:hypothetical protein
MKGVRLAVAVALAFLGALVPLLLLDGDRRTSGFRVYGLALGLLLLRAVITFTTEAEEAPPDSPFRRPRRLPDRLRRLGRTRPADATTTTTATDRLVTGAVDSAGAFHFRLRPVLRAAADERLRAHHGVGIDDPAAAELLGPTAAALLTADRPPPTDRRTPGPDAATLATLLTAVERL